MSAIQERPSRGTTENWTGGGITGVEYGGSRLKASAIPAIAGFTLASLVGLAHFTAPWYAYAIASVTGVIFGLLLRLRRWRKPTKYG